MNKNQKSEKINRLQKCVCSILHAILVLCALCEPICADNTKYLLSDRSVFPSEELADWIAENIEGASDGRLSEYECLRVSEIDLSSQKQIKSIRGIEVFSRVFSLNVSGSGITEIDVSGMKRLAFLDVSHTEISKIDLKENKMLYDLNIDGTNVSCLDLSSCAVLHSLSFKRTPVKSLDLRKNCELFYLSGRESALSEIMLGKNERLTVVDLAHTSLESVDLSKCPSLAHLDASSSACREVLLFPYAPLEYIDLSKTMVSMIDTCGFEELLHLDLSASEVKDVNVTSNKKLSYINLSDTDTEYIDLSENKELSVIIALNTKICRFELCTCASPSVLLLSCTCEEKTVEAPKKESVEKEFIEEKENCKAKTEEISNGNSDFFENPLPTLCIMHKKVGINADYFSKKLSLNLLQKR